MSGSDHKSQSRLVTTTVGISLRLRPLLPTICPADWKLKREIGAIWFQTISFTTGGTSPAMAPLWIVPAATSIQADWSRNDRTRVLRRCGPKKRDKREKKKEPRTKQTIDISDLAQPYGLRFCPDAPRPTKIVLPVSL